LVAEDLACLTARHDAPAPMPATRAARNSVSRCRPAPLPRPLSADLTPLSPAARDGWRHARAVGGVAPSTIHTSLSARHRRGACLQAPGPIPRAPVLWRRHPVLVPPHRPRPRAEEDLSRFLPVLEALRDRLVCVRLLRCGLRVGAVSPLTWSALHVEPRALRMAKSPGRLDRVVYDAPDGAPARRPWRRPHPPKATDVLPSPLQSGTPRRVRALQPRLATSRRQAQSTPPSAPPARRQSLCDTTPQGGSGVGGRDRTDGPPRYPDDPARHAALGGDHTRPRRSRQGAAGTTAVPAHEVTDAWPPRQPAVSRGLSAAKLLSPYPRQCSPASAAALRGPRARAGPAHRA
jgi:hypothetical protein